MLISTCKFTIASDTEFSARLVVCADTITAVEEVLVEAYRPVGGLYPQNTSCIIHAAARQWAVSDPFTDVLSRINEVLLQQ